MICVISVLLKNVINKLLTGNIVFKIITRYHIKSYRKLDTSKLTSLEGAISDIILNPDNQAIDSTRENTLRASREMLLVTYQLDWCV